MALKAGCNCWVVTCSCGEVNGGCVRFPNPNCDKCNKPLKLPDHKYLFGIPLYEVKLNEYTWFGADYQI